MSVVSRRASGHSPGSVSQDPRNMKTAFEPVVPVEQITPEWLTAVLVSNGRFNETAKLVDVQRETCGTGQLGDSYRFTLIYDAPAAGPATLVGKFASKDPTSREFGSRSGYYRSEIGFYTELAPQLSMSIPTAFHAALAANATDFVLLMEDLAPARQVDKLLGCSADESARVLEQAASLHAATWHDSRLAALDWLKGPVAIFTHATDNFAQIVKTFPDLCGDLVPDSDLREAAAADRSRGDLEAGVQRSAMPVAQRSACRQRAVRRQGRQQPGGGARLAGSGLRPRHHRCRLLAGYQHDHGATPCP